LSRPFSGVAARFFVVLAVLVPSLFAVAAVGARGLQYVGGTVSFLYGNTVLTAQSANDLTGSIADAHQTALAILASDDPALRQRLYVRLVQRIVPDVDAGLALLRTHLSADERIEVTDLDNIVTDWRRFVGLVAVGKFTQSDAHLRSAAASEVSAALDHVAGLSRDITHHEADQARAANELAGHRRTGSLALMAVVLGLALTLGVGVVLWLIRSVLPRTLAYSRFAARVADGDDAPMDEPRGDDEISQLGRVLQGMAERGRARRAYERTQFEFTETMQLTETEPEAHHLLKRHLERSLPGTEVTVLNRNNSADRLEAVTFVPEGSLLAAGLSGARPRSCLAVRQARPHSEISGSAPLVECAVCAGCAEQSTCTPLLVGGEVIGSVLALHPDVLTEDEASRIHESVVQAAPVLANLRHLAITELRAATDALTGLPNKRALTDTLKRMVAQADRTQTTLAMLMLDLDHFKQINDRFGHGRGDEVLAAVGAALSSVTRKSDFAGRYGGEEFVLLLQAVSMEGAATVAEKIRDALAEITVAPLDEPVTASIGIAMMPEHGVDPDTLERAADRALYAAKRNGRDRIEIAGNLEPIQSPPGLEISPIFNGFDDTVQPIAR
jgi:diguanylate cyclase (GGDEF)-like protein